MTEIRMPLLEQIQARFGEAIASAREALGQYTIEVSPERLIEVARALRDEKPFRFQQLTDLCGVDYLSYGQSEWETDAVTDTGFSRGVEGAGPGRFDWAHRPRPAGIANRFAAVVHLLSLDQNVRLRLRCFAADDSFPVVPSLTDVWSGANWFEREAFDLYGIVFEGHPDLRRILTDYGFVGHPFRKDFPLIGNVEVRYDPDKGRVVYEPVSIEPRVGVPRVVREDSRYLQAQNESAGKPN
ncbi:MAG: NADH-quinone oxidoreductase subunit C [Lysobacterales bacterium]